MFSMRLLRAQNKFVFYNHFTVMARLATEVNFAALQELCRLWWVAFR